MEGVAYWLVPPGLLNLRYKTQDRQPRDGTTHSGLAPLHQLVIMKMLPRHLMETILQLRFALSR